MKLVIQRVLHASVTVDGTVTGEIKKGLLVFAGVEKTDTESTVDKFTAKLAKLRIFEDQDGKTNLSLTDVGGELLIVSQFTLMADCRGCNRPGFTDAGDPVSAQRLYEYMLAKASEYVPVVQHGIFGADMKVELLNDGPFTIILDNRQLRLD
jgi:D-tyrosyl-tRNA(Tyr) deacylase